jgi:hypothetical protein
VIRRTGNERSIASVPGAARILLVGALAVQLGLHLNAQPPKADAADLPTAPHATAAKLLSGGDPVPLAKGLMLYLQAFDQRADNRIPYSALDYDLLIPWLDLILKLDPSGQYPLHAASRLYAEVHDPAKQRKMLEFVFEKFLADPNRRWPWLAHAAAIAKHELKDLPLARKYAAAIQAHATGPSVPLWARQMEAFILEDMNELETARIMIGGFVSSGQVKDPGELRFLENRLREIESKLAMQRSGKAD